MRLYNTLSQQVEELTFADGVVKMYVCGITPYDTTHLGHARVSVVYDTLRRYLERQGLQVRYVQNVTDIDEPLFERARRDGVRWQDLGAQQTQRYLDSLARLNVQKPEYYVTATSAIPQMLPIIARLIEQGHAYVRNGTVYYHAASYEPFGQLAHADYPALLAMANEMGNRPDDPQKLDPIDFVLWQPSQPDEPAWDSPWGPGRPGWHIECSTLAMQYLGDQVDIHGGGADLIFPHHSCEIAQAEPVTGVAPFVRCWMHVGLVALDGTKMSKSLGNMVFVDQILAAYSQAALRLALLNYPYHQLFEYSEQDVARAETWAQQIATALDSVSAQGGAVFDGAGYHARFWAALAENFDTPAAVQALVELAAAISEAVAAGRDVQMAQTDLRDMRDTLGVDQARA